MEDTVIEALVPTLGVIDDQVAARYLIRRFSESGPE